MSVGIHIATDFISTATLSSGGDFVFYEQIETPAHDAGTLCRHIAELVAKSGADPAAAVSVAINTGLAPSRHHQIARLFWPNLILNQPCKPALADQLTASHQRRPMHCMRRIWCGTNNWRCLSAISGSKRDWRRDIWPNSLERRQSSGWCLGTYAAWLASAARA